MILPEDKRQLVKKLLYDGCTVAKISRSLGVRHNIVYNYAKFIGWNPSWRNVKKYPNSTKGFKSKLQISEEEIINRRKNGESLQSIADDAGCTREYIRQIGKKHGLEGAWKKKQRLRRTYAPLLFVLKARIKQLRSSNIEINKIERDHEQYYEAHLLWLEGKTLKEIAKFLNIKNSSLHWIIGRLRKQYGWFLPKRPPGGNKKDLAIKRKELWEKAKPHWPCSPKELAKILGMKESAVSSYTHRMRKKYGYYPID